MQPYVDMSYRDDDPIFQDGNNWYFWDEGGTKYLGPFPDREHAEEGIEEYERYLATGEHTNFLSGTVWHSPDDREANRYTVREIMKARNVAGSTVVSLPKSLREPLDINTGDRLMISLDRRNNRLVITKE